MRKTLSYFTEVLHREFAVFCGVRLQDIGLTQGLMYFVIYIGRNPNCAPGALASTMKYDNGHTARCLEKLTEEGFVTRSRNESDRRGYILNLTEKGNNAMEDIRGILYDWEKVKFSNISQDDQQNLLQLLEKIEPSTRSEIDA